MACRLEWNLVATETSSGETMKTIGFGILALALSGCVHVVDFGPHPPAAPAGLYTETGDDFIEIFWAPSREPDLGGYNVYWSASSSGPFELLGTTSTTYFPDYGAVNGRTYYYAVSAFNHAGMESDLSGEIVYDVPRPEGYNVPVTNFVLAPSTAGYEFGSYHVVPFDHQYADMFFEFENGEYFMNVYSDTDIQDMGYTYSLLDVRLAPATGWSPARRVPVRVGHTYVVWTWDDHYAKFRVTGLSQSRVIFDWAYQLQRSNPMLKRPAATERSGRTAAAR